MTVKRKQPISPKKAQYRFGIAEWYGRSFVTLTDAERRAYAEEQFQESLPNEPCPFLSTQRNAVTCGKKGGVCSLRSYQKSADGIISLDKRESTIRTTCPSRFEQGQTIYPWIASVLLKNPDAVPIGQINFLERVPLIGASAEEIPSQEDVGVLTMCSSFPVQTRWSGARLRSSPYIFQGKKWHSILKQFATQPLEGCHFLRKRDAPTTAAAVPRG